LKGFTLIEVLTALVIITILAALSTQGMQSMLLRGQEEDIRNTLLQTLNHARNEAQIRHQIISICHSRDQRTCSGTWSDGILMFIDVESDGVIHERDQIIGVTHFKSNRNALHARFFPAYRDYLQFTPLSSNSDNNGTFWYCHSDKRNPEWAIGLNKMAEAHVLLPGLEGKIHDAKGKLILC
jgi:type IV fimbrial biogenesis protein FimT